jgi:hypothetical protein
MLACSICKVSPPFLYAPIRGLSSVLVTKAEKFVFTLYVPRPFTQVYTGCLVTESREKKLNHIYSPTLRNNQSRKRSTAKKELKKHTYPTSNLLLACSNHKVSPPFLYAPIRGLSFLLVTKAEQEFFFTICPPALYTGIHGLPCYWVKGKKTKPYIFSHPL